MKWSVKDGFFKIRHLYDQKWVFFGSMLVSGPGSEVTVDFLLISF